MNPNPTEPQKAQQPTAERPRTRSPLGGFVGALLEALQRRGSDPVGRLFQEPTRGPRGEVQVVVENGAVHLYTLSACCPLSPDEADIVAFDLMARAAEIRSREAMMATGPAPAKPAAPAAQTAGPVPSTVPPPPPDIAEFIRQIADYTASGVKNVSAAISVINERDLVLSFSERIDALPLKPNDARELARALIQAADSVQTAADKPK